MSLLNQFRSWLLSFQPPPIEEPPAPPVRPEHPCGVGDCYEPQAVIRQDERETVVECPIHQCITSWETKPREKREQVIIRVQDNWRQHGTKRDR